MLTRSEKAFIKVAHKTTAKMCYFAVIAVCVTDWPLKNYKYYEHTNLHYLQIYLIRYFTF